MCDMTHSYKWHDLFICMAWLIHVCDMTGDMTNSTVWHASFIIMGWLWLVGSIKLQVSFAKETYKRDDILQKRPIISSILLTVATPYDMPSSYVWLDSFMCVTWLVTWRIQMCDMTHSYVWHASFIRVTCLIHICAISFSYLWIDSYI